MEGEYQLSKSTYEWSVRLFSRLKKLLGINIQLHQESNSLIEGDIFLFNHFARIETFIPQYLIYKETGVFCRSIASSEFFKPDDAFSNYIVKLGGVPNNRPDLLPFLAREILRGRKVVLFPEGGMVKDRSVVDQKGRYNVYSRTAKQRRKHHTGAALLAMALEGFKTRIKLAENQGDIKQLESWKESLELESIEALLVAANKPTNIIPANITFYPIHIDDNFLLRSVEMINRKKLSRRAKEELIIESNLVMKNTDMDIRLGHPIAPRNIWRWWDRCLLNFMNKRSLAIEDYFNHSPIKNRLLHGLVSRVTRHTVGQLRDQYMKSMYSLTTINLSHLASVTIFKLIDRGVESIEEKDFYRMLYLSIKNAQNSDEIFLHRNLRDPAYYEKIIEGQSKGILTFLNSAFSSQLIKKSGSKFIFSEKLRHEHELDQIRLRNIIAVYANEASPIKGLSKVVETAITEEPEITEQEWAQHRFHDEHVSYNWHKDHYSKPHHQTINELQTATHTGEPYLLIPESPRKLGIVLVHGLPASPAELKTFAERLEQQGYPVIGVRLAGHGTSPWDLKERSWPEWVASVRRSYDILSAYCDQVCLVGFSTGAVTALHVASENPEKLAGVVSVAAPIKFSNRSIVFVPLVYGLTKLVGLVKSEENTNPFRINDSHHPEINYRHIPIRAIYELRLMIDALKKRLPDVKCPSLIMHADDDTVVDVSSARIIEKNIGSDEISVITIPSNRHGLILEDIGDSQTHIMAFLTRLAESEQDEPKHDPDVDFAYS